MQITDLTHHLSIVVNSYMRVERMEARRSANARAYEVIHSVIDKKANFEREYKCQYSLHFMTILNMTGYARMFYAQDGLPVVLPCPGFPLGLPP